MGAQRGIGEPTHVVGVALEEFGHGSNCLLSYAGVTLGGEVDREVVGSLHLPSFSSLESVGRRTTEDPPIVPMKETKAKEETPGEAPFVLSEALPVVPAKLVRRILKAEYVVMAELLKDNMEAERRRWQLEGPSPQGHYMGRTTRREIPDVLSWLQCFAVYAAVVTSKFPEKTRELLAYQAMIIAEARRCGGAWLVAVRCSI